MRSGKPVPLFPIVLSAPFAVLAFFAVRTLGIEYDALSARRTALLEERLEATGNLISARLELLGVDGLLKAREVLLTRGKEALRYFVLTGGVSFALVFNDEGRIFPPDDSDWLLARKQGGLRSFEEPAQTLRPALAGGHAGSAAALIRVDSGEHALLRCARDVDRLDVCIAIDPADVESDLSVTLKLLARDVGAEKVWLVASDNERLKQSDTSLTPTVSLPLSGLLSGWRIEAIDVAGARSNSIEALTMFGIGGALIVGWGALAWSLHRSSVLKEEGASRRAQLTAQLSHELRTPLANLRLYVDLMRRKSGDALAMVSYCAVVENEIGRLEQLAENAIDVGRGAMAPPEKDAGSPDEVLAAIVTRFDPTFVSAGCTTHMTGGASAVVLFDRHAWERIAVNLLDNARKYAQGSRVDIATSLRGDILHLEIRDYGPGVPLDQQRRIFLALMRGSHTGVGGFGLGLAAVRQLALQNGGDAWVEDAAPGARFCVDMRVSLLPDEQEPRPCSS